MVYEKLEREFLGSTARYDFNKNMVSFIVLILFFVLVMAFWILYNVNRNWHLFFCLIIILGVFLLLGFFIMFWIYPYYFYRKQLKKGNINIKSIKFSHTNLRNYLFFSAVNELVNFLYEENMTQKSKVALLIKHYESIKVVKTNFKFPFLVVLSLVISTIVSLFSLSEERIEAAMMALLTIISLLTIFYIELKFIYFLNKLVFDTNDKYNYILALLTEVYLKRYSGSNLLKTPPDLDIE